MLEARGISVTPGQLSADVEGDIEEVNNKPVITKIRVRYSLKNISQEQRKAAERALSIHEDGCPAAVSVKRGIDIEWSCDFESDE